VALLFSFNFSISSLIDIEKQAEATFLRPSPLIPSRSINYRGNIMKRLAILLSFMIFAVLSASTAEEDTPTLSVVGEGMVTVPADMVMISATVESNNENSTLAQAENQEQLDRTKEALMAVGVKPEEIMSGKSSGFMSFQSNSRVCRTVNNTTICDVVSSNATTLSSSLTLQLKTKDDSRINQVLEAARSAGASAAVIGYSLSDTSSAVADARKKAVEDARSNAQGVAEAAGVRLGDVVDIKEYAYPGIMAAQSFGSSSQPGMVDVSTYVMVTYEIMD
jgi:uncharacterized protein YggE